MGDIKVNGAGSFSIHPDLGTYDREISFHHGNCGVSRTFSWDETTKSQWNSLWLAALAGDTNPSTWAAAGLALFGATDWGKLNAEAKEDIRERILSRT